MTMLKRSSVLLSNKITIRLVSINDCYELSNIPRLHTLIQSLQDPQPSAVIIAGDFISPSTLSSIDGGRGMVSTLRAAGLTHASLGNHEADVKLNVLRDRVKQLKKSDKAIMLNSNVIPSQEQIKENKEKYLWMTTEMKQYDVLTSPCGKIRIGLMGLLSDEDGIFRDGTFKSVPIHKLERQWDEIKRAINSEVNGGVHTLIPITHQSLARDRTFARYILRTGTGTNSLHQKQTQPAIIIGGHEHQPYLEVVRGGSKQSSNRVQIVKTGQDADRAAIIDLIFDKTPHTKLYSLEKINIELKDVAPFDESPKVKQIAQKHMKVIADMEATQIVHESLFPEIFSSESKFENPLLSSKRTRYQQTTVGALFCQAIKHELEADACIINGAPIKGDAEYESGSMSYSQLKNELPFPLKMIVVKMTRGLLNKAISYSRLSVDNVKPKDGSSDFQYDDIERRGYLQTDYDYMVSEGKGDKDEILSVALPRNILNGFCSIKPLMELGEELKAAKRFPSSDDFMKAIDIIVRFCCKERWVSFFNASNKDFNLEDLDIDSSGGLKRSDVRTLLTNFMGEEPSDFHLEDMMSALDEDSNGFIDEEELKKVLDMAKLRNRN